jgi:hypothetical protein
MLAGLEILFVVDDFETYIQFAKLIKLQGTCLFRIWLGEFCCGVEWKYLVVE